MRRAVNWKVQSFLYHFLSSLEDFEACRKMKREIHMKCDEAL